jgi:hypothetical protein
VTDLVSPAPWTAARLDASVAPDAQTSHSAAMTDARLRCRVRDAMGVFLPK